MQSAVTADGFLTDPSPISLEAVERGDECEHALFDTFAAAFYATGVCFLK
jgi:hypothetical protein